MMTRAHTLCNKSRSKSQSAKKRQKLGAKKEKREQHIKGVVIEDADLLSREQLKKLAKQPTNNIRVSGKRKRKMLKRLRHSVKDKNQMDVEVEEPTTSEEANVVVSENMQDSDVEMT